MLTHFTGVEHRPPDTLFFHDKRRGNLPANILPGRASVEPGILSNFEFINFDREPIFGSPPPGAANLWIQTGANQGQGMWVSRYDMRATSLGIDVIVVEPRDMAENSLQKIDEVINMVSLFRARTGAEHTRLEFALSNVDNQAENIAAAESRIRDADMAKEMTEFTRSNILTQAATIMLAQANALPQNVLQLLG
jgi:flagellin